jgi:hypothetical protein
MLVLFWIELAGKSGRPTRSRSKSKAGGQECLPYTWKQQSRPTVPCDGPRMNPSVDVGNPPRPFRHLRMTERRTPDPSSSRVPVHSALVQKSVTAITNPAGRLSIWMLGKTVALGKWKTANSWQVVCNESNYGAGFRASGFGFGRVRPRIGLQAMDPLARLRAGSLEYPSLHAACGSDIGSRSPRCILWTRNRGSYERWVNETQRRRLVG